MMRQCNTTGAACHEPPSFRLYLDKTIEHFEVYSLEARASRVASRRYRIFLYMFWLEVRCLFSSSAAWQRGQLCKVPSSDGIMRCLHVRHLTLSSEMMDRPLATQTGKVASQPLAGQRLDQSCVTRSAQKLRQEK